jgi:hypothetical protein
MFGVAVLLIAQAATPPVETERAAYRSVSPTYPYELRTQVTAYLACLQSDGSRRPQDDEKFEAVFQRDIDRCDADLQDQTVAAFQVWKVGRDEETARTFVTDLFVRLREHHLERGRNLDRLNAEAGDHRRSPSNDHP